MDFSRKKIWIITYPVLISLLMQNLIGMTDSVFMGYVGEIEFGAVGLGGIYYLVAYMIGFGFSVGAEIVIGRRNGEKDYKSIGKIFYHGVIFMLALAAVMFALSRWLSPMLLKSFISSEKVYLAMMEYTEWRIFGFFFSFVAIMFRAFYMGTTNTRILTINSIIMVACNVGLNYVLVFGKLGLPALGIAGAAIGSVISELVSALYFIIYTRYYTDYKKYRLFKVMRYSGDVLGQIFKVAGWTMIQFFASCGTWLFFFVATEHLGERSLAISNLVRNVSALLYLFVSAFATTGSAMVSNLMGAGKVDEVMPLCNRIIRMCVQTTLPLLLLTAIFPWLMLRIYTDNAELITDAIPSMWVMLCSYIFSVPGFVYFLAISGTGNTKATFVIEIAILSVYVFFTYLFAFYLQADIAVCWTVESIYGSLMLIITYCYLRRPGWKLKKV